jgi:hypothetical protein
MALIHNGTLYFWERSAGFSGKPHGSAKIRCFTLGNEIRLCNIYTLTAKGCLVSDNITVKTRNNCFQTNNAISTAVVINFYLTYLWFI